MKTPEYLSKTKIMAGMQCPKNLFLQVYHKKLAAAISPQEQMIFDQGNLVGELAQKEFKKNTAIVDTEFWNFKGALQKTEQFILQNKEHIFEASFSYKGIFARVDILQKVDDKSWNLIEVKSGTKVKEENIKDVALQLWILTNLGYKINKVYLMHINNQCQPPDMSDFFYKQDISLKAKELSKTIENSILKLKKIIEDQKMPLVDIGPHCNQPYECKFKSHCGKNLSKQSIFLLPSMADNDFQEAAWKKKLWAFYKNNILEIKDIDQKDLNAKQQIAQKVHIKNQDYINQPLLKADLKNLQWPVSYLSFNSLNPAVPLWNGVRPYQKVVFQYQLAKQKDLNSKIIYTNYLHHNEENPSLSLAENLAKEFCAKGSVLCYHKAFDGHKLKVLAELYPHLKSPLLDIKSRLLEPSSFFKKNIYLKSFKAQTNIKAIALAIYGKDFFYKDLKINDTALAQMAYQNWIQLYNNADPLNKEIQNDLADYGKQGVFVLVKAMEYLYRL